MLGQIVQNVLGFNYSQTYDEILSNDRCVSLINLSFGQENDWVLKILTMKEIYFLYNQNLIL